MTTSRNTCEDTGYMRRDCFCNECSNLREELEELRDRLEDWQVRAHMRVDQEEVVASHQRQIARYERML